MDIIISLLIYLLASAALVSVGSIFGLVINIFQAFAVWVVFSLIIHIAKNF